MKKGVRAFLTRAFALCLIFSLATSAYAMSYKDFGIGVSKNSSYTKDGKFYMKINENATTPDYELWFTARLINSSGKAVFTWNKHNRKGGTNGTMAYGANYSNLPGGKYTFQVLAGPTRYGDTFKWNYTINHAAGSVSFKSTERVVDTMGNEKFRFNIQCNDIKGKALTFEVYDAYGRQVYKGTGPQRQTNNEVGWFAWDYYPTNGGLKCDTGDYTLKVSYPGGTPIQKTYYIDVP